MDGPDNAAVNRPVIGHLHVGLLVLAALVGVESMGIPLPGETALIAAAVLAQKGRFPISTVLLVAAGAAIVGDNLGYLLGRKGGRWLLERPGFLLDQRRRVLERGEAFFARHGSRAVFLGRWVPFARYTAAWLAGTHRMPWPTFLLWNALGAVAWAASIGLLGFFLGAATERLFGELSVVGIAVVLSALFVISLLVFRRESSPRKQRIRRQEGT